MVVDDRGVLTKTGNPLGVPAWTWLLINTKLRTLTQLYLSHEQHPLNMYVHVVLKSITQAAVTSQQG